MRTSRTIIGAGLTYFALVFGAGFVFGTIRQLWVVPWLGVMRAELLEMPIMLTVIVLAARVVVTRFRLPSRASVGVGSLALSLLVLAELTLVLGLRGLPLTEYIETREPVSSTVYLVMLVVFAAMPFFIARHRTRE